MTSPERTPVFFEFDPDKAVAVISYLASRSEDVTAFDRYKAAKLIFLADKYHLVRYGRPILGDEYRALEFGPIPASALNLLNGLAETGWEQVSKPHLEQLRQLLEVDRAHQHVRFAAKGLPDLGCLSKSEVVALEHVITQHGRKSFPELLSLTHSTAAYRRAWESRPSTAKAVSMRYEDFFEEDADAVAGALDEMLENDALRKAFPSRLGF